MDIVLISYYIPNVIRDDVWCRMKKSGIPNLAANSTVRAMLERPPHFVCRRIDHTCWGFKNFYENPIADVPDNAWNTE